MTILFLALWLQMSAQINAKDFKMSDCNKPGMTCTIADGWKSPAPPAAPAIGHIECWNDDATKHFSCMSPKGSILDVESALNKLDENTWSNEGNGGGKPGYACIPGDERKECAITFAESAVDVPAVQVKTSAKLTLAYAGNCVNGYGFEGEKWQCTGKLVWSCADKSRILEHDENSPPKYWCRKVEF